jgi:UDP-2,3-diacylglucosamine hydrolase
MTKTILILETKLEKKIGKLTFLNKTLDERKQIAATLREDSKEATSKKSDAITDVNNQSVEDFINKHQPHLFIHGHTHRPNIHDVGNSKRVVLGDWGDYGWLLTINEQEFNLEKFSIA